MDVLGALDSPAAAGGLFDAVHAAPSVGTRVGCDAWILPLDRLVAAASAASTEVEKDQIRSLSAAGGRLAGTAGHPPDPDIALAPLLEQALVAADLNPDTGRAVCYRIHPDVAEAARSDAVLILRLRLTPSSPTSGSLIWITPSIVRGRRSWLVLRALGPTPRTCSANTAGMMSTARREPPEPRFQHRHRGRAAAAARYPSRRRPWHRPRTQSRPHPRRLCRPSAA
jgi:hypothetical protein